MIPRNLEKQINILDYALTSLWRRRMKNIGLITVFAGVIFLLASFQMVNRSLTGAAEEVLGHAPEITVQRMSAGRQVAVPVSYEEQIREIFGIRGIVPRVWGYYFDDATLANYTVIALDTRAMPRGKKLHLALAEGELPTARGEVALGYTMHQTLDQNGRRIFSLFRPDLSLKPLTITGIFARENELLTADLILMGLEDGRDLFAIGDDQATDLLVYVSNPAEVETIAKKIKKTLPDTRVLTRPQIKKTYQVIFGWRSGLGSICLFAALAAFVILAWDKASGLSPEEKREIGILKILGWETTDILAIRFWESFLVSTLAYIIGCTMAYIHVAFFSAALFKPVMLGWSVLKPSVSLPPAITSADLLLILAFTVLPYLAATVIPAWRSATVPPDAAIK